MGQGEGKHRVWRGRRDRRPRNSCSPEPNTLCSSDTSGLGCDRGSGGPGVPSKLWARGINKTAALQKGSAGSQKGLSHRHRLNCHYNLFYCFVPAGRGGGRRSISVGTAMGGAHFLPTARTGKKWCGGARL